MNTPHISVIIPVYNAAKTLPQCAANLINQTLPDIELLFIDDCSTDDSPAFLSALAEHFPAKVRVYKTVTNSGPGGARNIGLSHASGEYIGFVDSDDLADCSMFEKLYKAACAGLSDSCADSSDSDAGFSDLVDCGWLAEEDQSVHAPFPAEWAGELSSESRNLMIASEGYLWNKIFRRELIKKHHLRFRENCNMEDTDFVIFFYAVARRMNSVPEVLYRHSHNVFSATSLADSLKVAKDSAAAMSALYERLSCLDGYELLRPGTEAMMINLAFSAVFHLKAALPQESASVLLPRIKDFFARSVKGGFDNPYLPEGFVPACSDYLLTAFADPAQFLTSD